MSKKLLFTAALFLIGGSLYAAVSGGKWANFVQRIVGAFGKNLTSLQQQSALEIARAFDRYGDGDLRKLVYMLAVAWHESRLQPIREIRAAPGTAVYEIQNGYWHTGFFGRGYVQLSLRLNYEKMSRFLGVDLVNNPDLALQPQYAARIMVYGMMEGVFTGKKLSDYITPAKADYYNARRTVGSIMVAGTDTAALIEGHVKSIFKSLNT
jgi:hypothetical protein